MSGSTQEEVVTLVPLNQVGANFYKLFQRQLTSNSSTSDRPDVPYEKLNPKQQKVIDIVKEHLTKDRSEMLDNQLMLLVQGAAGTSLKIPVR